MYRNTASATIGNEKRGEIKLYAREYEKDYSNKLGPGPGGYEVTSSS